MKAESRQIAEFTLKLTCSGCPEQYDVLKGDAKVGYLRLRHGHFYAAVPDVGGERIYTAEPDGDGWFEDHEREKYLTEACDAIRKYLANEGKSTL